jgi:hypothetical protein
MGSWISTPTSNNQGPTDPLLPPRSPPHPSRSDLNPNLTTRSGFSYFLPVTRPELQTSHLHPTLGDVREVADLLGRKIPPELVCRVMEEARYWAGCRNLLQKDLDVKAGQGSPRTLPPGIDWRNGQEDSISVGIGLKEGDGEIWYLLSEEIGSEDIQRAGSSAAISNSDPQTVPFDLVTGEKSDHGGETRTHDEEVMEPGCWAREIIIETLSKDQGWSTAVTHNPALYGKRQPIHLRPHECMTDVQGPTTRASPGSRSVYSAMAENWREPAGPY